MRFYPRFTNRRDTASGPVAAPAARRRRSRRLLLESLEGRRLLATIDLASLGSDGVVLDGVNATRAGWSVSSAGDVNGDGFDDILIGAPNTTGISDTSGSTANAGNTYVVYGAATPPASISLPPASGAGVTIRGIDATDQSGRSVSGVGDVNGDGFDDLAIGADQAESGEAYIVFGGASLATTINLKDLEAGGVLLVAPPSGPSRIGSGVSGAGDVNGDGLDDVLVGAGFGTGTSYLIYGSTSFPESIALAAIPAGAGVTINGVNTDDLSGFSVSVAGDFNGDGFDDLLIGAPLADASGDAKSEAGDTYLVLGGPSLPTPISLNDLTAPGAVGTMIFGGGTGDQAGYSVRGAGDVNGDGLDDLIVGAPFADGTGDGRPGAGDSYLIYGTATPPTSIDLDSLASGAGVVLLGAGDGDETGFSVSGAGDVNGDGYDDLLIGAPQADASGNAKTAAGDSYLVFGGPSLADTIDLSTLDSAGVSVGFTAYGATAGGQNGTSVSGAGDVDGDGFDDALTAAREIGSTYLVFGGNTGAVTHAGTAAADTLTGTVAADVMVGGQGNDLLIGGGGADVLRGGEGDDVLAIGDLGVFRVHGGTGVDTLRVDGTGLTLDLTALADNRLTDIEQIDLSGGTNNQLTLNLREVLNLSTHSNSLRVYRNTGTSLGSEDMVNRDGGWTAAGTEMFNGDLFEVYTQGRATLYLQIFGPDITVTHTDGDTSPAEHGVAAQKTDTFTVVLDKVPAGNVVVNVTSSDTGEATASPATLTFTTSNWNTPQTVTITGQLDEVDDGDMLINITLSVDAAQTADDDYDALPDVLVPVTVIDVPNTPTVTAPTGSSQPLTPTFEYQNVADETSYSLWLVDMSTSPPSLAYSNFNIPVDTTSFTIPVDLVDKHSYRYFFRAEGSEGFSAWTGAPAGSAFGEFTVGKAAPTAPPPAPVVNGVSSSQEISWDAATTNTADHYGIYLVSMETGELVVSERGILTNSYTPDPALAQGRYRVWVSATNSAGYSGYGPHHDFEIGTPAGIPAAPVADEFNSSTYQFSWDASTGATSYGVYLVNLDTGTLVESRNDLTTNAFTPADVPLSAGKYRIWVSAKNSAGSSGFGPAADFEVGTVEVPAAPINLSATGSNPLRPMLQWDPVTGAGTYGFYLVNMGTGQAVASATHQTATSFTPASELDAGQYRFWARASNGEGTGPWSEPLDFSIPLPPPPSLLAPAIESGEGEQTQSTESTAAADGGVAGDDGSTVKSTGVWDADEDWQASDELDEAVTLIASEKEDAEPAELEIPISKSE